MANTLIFKTFLIIFNSGIGLAMLAVVLLINKAAELNVKRYLRNIGFFLIALLLAQYALYVYIRHIEPNWIQVERVDVSERFGAYGLEGLKIVQISDLHTHKYGFRERSMASKINKIDPDIILITGDFITYRQHTKVVVQVLSQIRAKKGIYAVLGNIDHTAYRRADENVGNLAMVLEGIGIKVLRNSSVRIPINNEKGLWLIGTDYYKSNNESLKKAYQGVNMDEAKILLTHYPTTALLDYIRPENTDLILAGDTHGTQVGLAFLRDFSKRTAVGFEFIAGMYDVKGVPLYVNRGIGTQHKDIRLLCRPEITVFKT